VNPAQIPLGRWFWTRMRLRALAGSATYRASRFAMHGLIGLGGYVTTMPGELIVTLLDGSPTRMARTPPPGHPESIPLTRPRAGAAAQERL
jgi:hypothetical protein